MNLLKLTVLINVMLTLVVAANAQSATDRLLSQLDTVLANKQLYVNKKQQEINRLALQVTKAGTPKEKYNLYKPNWITLR